jgi:cytosine/adenosine deaminase-related metal-dependent hydrolase
LIRGKYVICGTRSRTEAEVIEGGAVFQRDGTIVEVGRYADLAARYQPDELIGSAEHLIFPGFVNAHHHVGLTPFQLGSPDYPLELWFASRLGARDVDPYLDTLYSAFEMLESGVTTVQHLHGWRVAPASRVLAIADRILRAYEDIGMRVSYSFALCDQNRLVYEADEAFLRRLPPELAVDVAAWFHARTIPLDDQPDLFADLWDRCQRNTAERVRVQLAPANLHWCSDAALRALRETANRYRVGMHMHLVETAFQKAYARRRTGTTAVRHLATLGLLGQDLTLGHGVWLTEEDLDLVARSSTMVCHNASSNLRLRSGIAPLTAFAERGIRVALGIDEAGLNDDRDMLQEMRLVLRLHRMPGMDEAVPTPTEVFGMATEHGAATTPFASRIGTLQPGKAADLVVMNWRHVAYPYLDPDASVVDALVHRGRASGVETVLVAGEPVLRDGRFTRVDKAAALEELAASLRTPPQPVEERRRRLARAVFPYVKNFYEGWLDIRAGDPFYAYNSRL